MDSYSDEITYPDSPVLDGSTGLKCDFCEHVLCSREQLLKHLQGHLCLDPACESCHHTPDAFLEHISNAKNHIKSNKVEAQRSSPENPIGNFQERGGHSASSNDEESQYVREDLPIARRKHKFFCTECDRSFHYKKDLTKHTLDNCYLATKGILNNVDMAFGSKNDDDLSTSDKVPLSITGETNNSNPESRVIFKNSLSTATKQVDIYSCCGNNGSAKLKILEDQVKSTSALKSDYHRKEAAPEETNVNNACSLPVGNHTYFCFSCGMSFTHKHFLSNHMKRHSESDHFCRYCGSGFATAFNVRRHENLHFPKNYRCPLCVKTFAHVYYLKVHMSSHSDVRKYLCNVCEKVFKTKYGLNKHSLRH